MRRLRRLDTTTHIELTPMIDVVFLLIIFFMVGTRFSEFEQQYDIELPQASSVEPMTGRPDAIVLHVARSGDVFIDGQQISLTDLVSRLESARERYADQAVLIRADGEGLYQPVVDVMDICHRARIKRFSLAFQPKATAPETGVAP